VNLQGSRGERTGASCQGSRVVAGFATRELIALQASCRISLLSLSSNASTTSTVEAAAGAAATSANQKARPPMREHTVARRAGTDITS
jgi:hypothetical protein